MADEVLHLKTRKYPAFARCGYYYQQTFYRKLMPEAHDHDFYEIICTLEGSFAHVINGVPYAFAPGWVTLLRPGDVHSLRAQQPGTNVFSLSVAPDEMERFLAAYGCALTRAPVFSISAVQQSEYRAQLERFMTIDPGARQAGYRVLVGMTLQYYLSAGAQALPGDDAQARFREALSLFNTPDNIREGVSALMRLSCFSHAQLCRVMKRQLGLTPQQYVVELRLNLAMNLIQNTAIDLNVVAESVGYSSWSHFNSIFTRRFQKTPGTVRRSVAAPLI